MDFNEKITDISEEVCNFETVELSDIPDIELYMDQVTTFIDAKLSCYKRNKDDKILTKTMINNYAKGKLFPPPQKKKYNKNHLMLLIIIYHLKSILSINDIYLILSPITNELNDNSNSKILEDVYSCFLKIQKSVKSFELKSALNFEEIANTLEIPENIKNTEKIKNILYILTLAFFANTEKRLSEKIIDSSFR
ncbi:DUF1836 domain-containing protein [Anaerotignum faecicola]|nr:DUF1836 domain-containing protein [Anaerotignum faecicola]